ncbi:pheromone A receptor-domain-containing protein [Russula aff. rugulosa BPL654]|nr:pheromone A receptor-domain-containing protein [Russula aff. rugulosa BPL654]
MINRVPVYCDISTRIQVALNAAIPASSLCINRQLYRVSMIKTARITDVEKRRNLIYDLLISVGIPVLQMAAEYVVSGNPFVLFIAWPVVIGTISFFYCVMSIYAFYKRRQEQLQFISSTDRGLYLRLMAISVIEIFGTIPLGTYYIVIITKMGVVPWKGWARMHSHYSDVEQLAGLSWRNDPVVALNLELFRWSLVACAFLFFALFGFSCEAREHYYRLYNSLARRIGKSPSTPHGAPHVTPSVPYVKRNGVVANPIMVQMGRHKDSLSTCDTPTE